MVYQLDEPMLDESLCQRLSKLLFFLFCALAEPGKIKSGNLCHHELFYSANGGARGSLENLV